MSTLRERMPARSGPARLGPKRPEVEDMKLRRFSPRTQQAHARAVRRLGEYYHKSTALVKDEELRHYFLYRTNVSRRSRVVPGRGFTSPRIHRLVVSGTTGRPWPFRLGQAAPLPCVG
jgi:hypothetical protein